MNTKEYDAIWHQTNSDRAFYVACKNGNEKTVEWFQINEPDKIQQYISANKFYAIRLATDNNHLRMVDILTTMFTGHHEYNYLQMKERIELSGLKDELIEQYYAPKNISMFIANGHVNDGFNDRWK